MRAPIYLLVLGMSAAGTTASADKLTEAPLIAPKIKLSKRIKANLNDYSNDVGLTLGVMTSGLLEMRFNLHTKQAKVGLGGGDPEAFRLRIDSDVLMARGRARIQSRIDLAISGHRLSIEVPEFDMDTESVGGERAVQLSLPLVEHAF